MVENRPIKVAVCLLDDFGRSREERVRVGNEGESLIPSPKGGVLVGWETPNITHGVTVTPNRASDDNFFFRVQMAIRADRSGRCGLMSSLMTDFGTPSM